MTNKLDKFEINNIFIYVSATFNNTKLTVTDNKGNVIMWDSSGKQGFKGSKRGSSLASQKAAMSITKKLYDMGVRSVNVFISGLGVGKESSVKAIHNGGISIISITDITKFPFNGCRPPSPRSV